jgi:hypothetical protein
MKIETGLRRNTAAFEEINDLKQIRMEREGKFDE